MSLIAVRILPIAFVLALASASLTPDNQPVEPFRIADGVYFVGASDLSSYLITTTDGHILIDSGYEATVPPIAASVAKLGFKMRDIKILLNTQAHFDHAAGLARLKEMTGARLMISEPDVPVIESGGRGDFVLTSPEAAFPPVRVDRPLRRRSSTARQQNAHRWTPGHTKGCTTWTFDAADRGKTYKVVVLCGLTILPGTRVSGMPAYPTIETDYERSFEVLKHLPVDIFLGAHPSYYDGANKARALRDHPDAANPFVDPAGFHPCVDRAEKRFREQLAEEKRRPPQQ
jgi:metallo-beta-lactamase class B